MNWNFVGSQRYPKFLGLGVQKGGTTTLQKLLEQHPQVWLSPQKELHFFSLHYDRGSRWYSNCFRDAESHQLCGDITPYYIFHPQAAKRIASLLPSVRLIVLLRDPVERCLSQYFHSYRLGLESLDLESALSAESDRLAGAEEQLVAPGGSHRSYQEHSYMSRSRYEHQLSRFEKYFNIDQFLLLRSEDLFENPIDVWGRILNFLCLRSMPFPLDIPPANSGRGESEKVSLSLRTQLRKALDPTYLAMKERYGITWLKS